MNVSPQLLNYNTLAVMTSQTSVTITCGIQPTGVVTMAMKVLHNTCNICIGGMPSTLRPAALYISYNPTNKYDKCYLNSGMISVSVSIF